VNQIIRLRRSLSSTATDYIFATTAARSICT